MLRSSAYENTAQRAIADRPAVGREHRPEVLQPREGRTVGNEADRAAARAACALLEQRLASHERLAVQLQHRPEPRLERRHARVDVVLRVGDALLDRARDVGAGDEQPVRLAARHDRVPELEAALGAERIDLVARLLAPARVRDDARHARDVDGRAVEALQRAQVAVVERLQDGPGERALQLQRRDIGLLHLHVGARASASP